MAGVRIAVIGADGQLGADIVREAGSAGAAVTALTHSDIEVADPGAVRAALAAASPDLVVNTAALHNVEQCEAEPDRAFSVNAVGACNVAIAARELGAAVVYVSTDYVFGGDKESPYTETDTPTPVNVYGASKLAGEHLVRAENPRHFVVRVSAIYGVDRCRAKTSDNFVRLMLRLAAERGEVRVVSDERVSPTWTAAIARQLLTLTGTDAYGLYHATSQGDCSWHEFALAIFEIAGANAVVHPALAADFPAKVRRPAYSVLDNAALRERGLDVMPHWRESLAGYLGVISGAGAQPGRS